MTDTTASPNGPIGNLNSAAQVANLPAHITYAEIVYRRAYFGLIGGGTTDDEGVLDVHATSPGLASYSVFGYYQLKNGGNLFFSSLSADTKNFLTNHRSPGHSDLLGDGLIPAAEQYYTTLPGFHGYAVEPLVNESDLSVHTDALSRVDDLLQQLRQLGPYWFP